MKKSLVHLACLLAATLADAQAPAVPVNDTWAEVNTAPDDRYTNPKSKLYSGPNGWFGTGRVKAEAGKARYEYKAGFVQTTGMFVGTESNKLNLMSLDFGTERPAPGTYAAGPKGDAAKRTVSVSFDDLSGGKMRGWSSADKAGSVVVSEVNGFRYFRFRNVRLEPNAMVNTGEAKVPMTIGFEGATPPER